MTSLRDSALSGVIWTALQTWFSRASGAAAFIILGRQLGPAEFGLIALAAAVTGVLSSLADSGLATYVVRAEKVDRRVLSTAFWTSVLLSAGLAGLLVGFAHLISAGFDEPALTPVLQWLAAGLVLVGFSSVPSAILRRELRFKQLALRGSVAVLVSSVVAVVLALAGAGVWALVAQTLVNNAVALVIVWAAARWRPGLTWDGAQAGHMLKFGARLLMIDLMGQARSRGQDFMIAGFVGPVGLGLWSVATKLLTIILDTGNTIINSVATPVYAKMQKDTGRLFRAFAVSLSTASAGILPLTMFLAATSPLVVPLILGEQWTTSATIAQILAVSAAVSSLSYFDRSLFVALDRLRVEFWLVFSSVVTQLAVVAATAHLGLTILALALTARNVVMVPIRMVVLRRTTGLPFSSISPALRVFLAAVLMAVSCWLVTRIPALGTGWLVVAACAATAAVVYPAALFLCARSVATTIWVEIQNLARRKRKRATPVPASAEAAAPAAPVVEEREHEVTSP